MQLKQQLSYINLSRSINHPLANGKEGSLGHSNPEATEGEGEPP